MKNEIATNFNQYTADPKRFVTIKDVPQELVERIVGFANFGINGNALVTAVQQAGPEKGPMTLGWSKILMDYGATAFSNAEIIEKNGNTFATEKAFLEASFWYFLARFPFILNADAAKAYALHTEIYLRALQYSPFPTQILSIAWNGTTVRTILRFPKLSKEKFPLVIIWGGIDIWKSDLEIHSQGNKFLENNMAVLAIDIPGTGECPISPPNFADSWFLTVLEHLRVHPYINANRIGCYGLSFGGYWAVKLAVTAPQFLAAAVNNSGPIHYAFQPQWLNKLPLGTKAALARIFGLDLTQNAAEILPTLASLSLRTQNLLPATTAAPLLSLDGENDELVPISDLYFLTEQGIKQDVLIFANDRHVASHNWNLHEKFVANWLAAKLISE